MFGPFTIEFSHQAERLDIDAIPDNVRRNLVRGRVFDRAEHDIYQFFVTPKFKLDQTDRTPHKKLPWKIKRRSYDAATLALVQAEPATRRILFLGMHPVTEDESGQVSLDLQADALFEVTIPKLFKTRLKGQAKSAIQRKLKHRVLASRTDNLVQWVFLNSAIQNGMELGMRILCAVPKDLAPADRMVICSAKYASGNRTLEITRGVSVSMPSAG